MVGFIAGLIRLSVYSHQKGPPMSLLTRLATGTPILPGYDRIVPAPLTVCLTAIVGPVALRLLGIYPPLMAGIMAVIILTMLVCLPPTLRHWHLTGQYRMLVVKPRLSKER